MLDIRKLTDEVSVAPQILASDLPLIAALGFRSLICNRPDGEGGSRDGSGWPSPKWLAESRALQPRLVAATAGQDTQRF